MTAIRLMTAADVPLGLHLVQQAGWNQTEADWRRFLSLQPDGCFVAEWDGQPVATTTTCVFGAIGWIGMVLVDESHRRQGIATRLMEQALAYLDQSGVRTARLDATALGRPVYERLGFVAEYALTRWSRLGLCPEQGESGTSYPAQVGTESQPTAVIALDRQVTGTDRRKLLERLFAERPEAAAICHEGGTAVGYVMHRPGGRAAYIGPAVALSAAVGCKLLDWAFQAVKQPIVFVDIPCDNQPATVWAEANGFTAQRRFVRMFRGVPIADQPPLLWASSGPEKG